MAQYIDKCAVIAEIEKRQSIVLDPLNNNIHTKRLEEVYKSILSFLDTLEMKEMDLEKELDYNDYMNFFKEHPEYDNEDWGFEETWTFGQYCYKLGLKAK